MKATLLLSLLLSTGLVAQETTAPASSEKEQPASTVIQPAPLDMDVIIPSERAPLQPKAEAVAIKVDKVYNEIKGSKFFLEINPLRMAGFSEDFESNMNTPQDNPELEYDANSFKLKLMPLDFKFGFDNEGWGSFAEVLIEDGDESSELVVFGKIGGHKLGAGLALNVSDEELKIKTNSVEALRANVKSTEIHPYFYASFELANNDTLILEQWNKIGGAYVKQESDDITIKGVSFIFRPALDIMFKINPHLLIGIGAEVEYQRFSGDLKSSGTKLFDGVGNTFSFELNLIKTRFVF